jgi:hypothetical protein
MFSDGVHYEFTRFLFQRALAFIYFVAFAIVVQQFQGLCGSRGLLPVKAFTERVDFKSAPSIFSFWNSDGVLRFFAWFGFGLSFLALIGLSDFFSTWISVAVWISLWLVYLSFVNVGQTFYGFGWEILLLESGFLAIFLGPVGTSAPVIVIWLLRWLLFRVMFGAGMIKIRGDPCWRDLTCLIYHYETQPMPNPLSRTFHHWPAWVHKAGVAFNHFVELIAPFFYFGPGPARIFAGLATIFFQMILIFSGNLSWLNCITIVIAIACFDDAFFISLFQHLSISGDWLLRLTATASSGVPEPVIYVLAVLVLLLSLRPVLNLISKGQIMNTSFDPLHLVNTYGAFGSIGREREELIIEGTSAATIDETTLWRAYEFKGKPGDPMRRPPQVTPYHYKLDWQMWFAPMTPYYYNPWLLSLIGHLLQGEPSVLRLLRDVPFKEHPPRFIRVRRYLYRFTARGEKGWWKRTLIGEYLPPLSLEDEGFRSILSEQGWLVAEPVPEPDPEATRGRHE